MGDGSHRAGLLRNARVAVTVPRPRQTPIVADVEAICQECGGPNVVWFAPNPIWNLAVDNERQLILCPVCFVVRAEARGINPTAWVVSPEDARP